MVPWNMYFLSKVRCCSRVSPCLEYQCNAHLMLQSLNAHPTPLHSSMGKCCSAYDSNTQYQPQHNENFLFSSVFKHKGKSSPWLLLALFLTTTHVNWVTRSSDSYPCFCPVHTQNLVFMSSQVIQRSFATGKTQVFTVTRLKLRE